MKIKGFVTKKGRKWFEVNLEPNGFETQMLINKASENLNIGDDFELEAELEVKRSQYGSVYQYIPISPEEIRDKKIASLIDGIRDAAKEGYFASKKYAELKSLGYDGFDEEAEKIIKTIEAKKEAEKASREAAKKEELAERWMGYIRESANSGKIYRKGIQVLKELGYYEKYQDEIAKIIESVEKNYRRIILQVYGYFDKKSPVGKIQVKDGRVYEIVSAVFDEESGYSFGVGTDAMWDCVGKDITDTERGKQALDAEAERIQREKQEAQELARQAEIARAADKLRRAIEENSETSLGDEIEYPMEAETVIDTMTAYGGGYEVKIDGDKAYLFVNNGADGDDWSRSNVKGFNFIGFVCSREKVEHELQEYKKLAEYKGE